MSLIRKINQIRTDKRVFQLETEPDIFVTLSSGYKLGSDFSQDGNACQHCFGEDSLSEVIETLKMVEPCSCDYCVEGIE